MAFSTKDSWLKINRARRLVEEIYRSFGEFIDGDELNIPVSSSADYESGCIVFRVMELPKANPELGALIGDAVHNYRSSLDYLWWQLAIRKLGRDPDEKEAKSIQFPILKNEDDWNAGHSLLRHVDFADASFVKFCQPFNNKEGNGSYTPFEALNLLSNHDKHRALTPYYVTAKNQKYQNNSDRSMEVEVFDLPDKIFVGTEVTRMKVDLNGLDVEGAISGEFRSYLSVQNKWNLLEAIEGIDLQCDRILKEAEKLFG